MLISPRVHLQLGKKAWIHLRPTFAAYWIICRTHITWYVRRREYECTTNLAVTIIPDYKKLFLDCGKFRLWTVADSLQLLTPWTTDAQRGNSINKNSLPLPIFRYGWSIFCLSHWPTFSGTFILCLHWVSVVCGWLIYSNFRQISDSHQAIIKQ